MDQTGIDALRDEIERRVIALLADMQGPRP
jgi:hypothetical protein